MSFDELLQMPSESYFDIMSFYGATVDEDRKNENCKICSLANDSGTGEFLIYKVLPGIRVVYNDMHMKYCGDEDEPAPNVIEINHCREGRFECNFGYQTPIYLSPGDFSIGALDMNATDGIFPTRHYHGITIFIEVDNLPQELKNFMNLLSIDIDHISKLICDERKFFLMRANESIEHIFSELYSIRESRKPGYLKIKVLELLLFLSDLKGEEAFNEMEYINRNKVNKMRQIHDFIVQDIKKHYTINELSDKFQISSTTMKRDFSKIYGTSIYAYLKIYRLQVAQKLLLNTDYSVAQIAAQIGYENPNKLTTAFKREYGISPTEFRKYAFLDR